MFCFPFDTRHGMLTLTLFLHFRSDSICFAPKFSGFVTLWFFSNRFTAYSNFDILVEKHSFFTNQDRKRRKAWICFELYKIFQRQILLSGVVLKWCTVIFLLNLFIQNSSTWNTSKHFKGHWRYYWWQQRHLNQINHLNYVSYKSFFSSQNLETLHSMSL